jgi:lysophospholipase L1-like esterase
LLRPTRHLCVLVLALLAATGLTACDSEKVVRSHAPLDEPKIASYVAIGDSYSAGSLIPLTDVANGCFRSDHNYPTLLADDIGAKLEDRTCSGAETKAFDQSQYPDVPPQGTALNQETDLVTVGLGGNDANVFRTLVNRCPALRQTDPTGAPCRDALRSGGKDVLMEQLAGTTQRLTEVLDEVHRRAPHAKVLAIGYPQIVDAGHVCEELPLAAGDYVYVEKIGRALTEAVRKAAAASGSTYVDVWKLSQGHDICSDDPWINGATNVQSKAPRYHPFAAEHVAVANLIESMLAPNQ